MGRRNSARRPTQRERPPDARRHEGRRSDRLAACRRLAAAHQLPVSSHLFPEISAHLLCVTPTAHRLEYADWWNTVLEQPLTLNDGHAVIDEDAPGTGVNWDDDVLARYATD